VKSFDNIQGLWDYCLFCPICQKDSRTVNVSAGPDKYWEVADFEKNGNILTLFCTYKAAKQSRHFIDYKFDCVDNTFQANISKEVPYPLRDEIRERIQEAYIFLDIDGSCEKCDCSTASSQSLELDMESRKVTNIQLEREKFFLLREKDKYHVTLWHSSNNMRVSKYDSENFEEGKEIELPLVNLNLIDQAKVINKLKTLILFS